jgi:hypothetical protein
LRCHLSLLLYLRLSLSFSPLMPARSLTRPTPPPPPSFRTTRWDWWDFWGWRVKSQGLQSCTRKILANFQVQVGANASATGAMQAGNELGASRRADGSSLARAVPPLEPPPKPPAAALAPPLSAAYHPPSPPPAYRPLGFFLSSHVRAG